MVNVIYLTSKDGRHHSWVQNGPRKRYELGDSPCGNCNLGKHTECRPRLDCTLCTCSCDRSTMMRDEFQRKCDYARVAGQPQPTVAEALRIFVPHFTRKIHRVPVQKA